MHLRLFALLAVVPQLLMAEDADVQALLCIHEDEAQEFVFHQSDPAMVPVLLGRPDVTVLREGDVWVVVDGGMVLRFDRGVVQVMDGGGGFEAPCRDISQSLRVMAERINGADWPSGPQEVAVLEMRLASALAGRLSSEAQLVATQGDLADLEALYAEKTRQVTVMTSQIDQLRGELVALQQLLDLSAAADAENQAQLEQLGAQLNAALARVAAEARLREALEEATGAD